MGSPVTEANRKDDEGEREVTLPSLCMSKFEITYSEFAAFLNAGAVGPKRPGFAGHQIATP